MTAVTLRLYRILLRQCRAPWSKHAAASSGRSSTAASPRDDVVLLQPLLDARDNGTHHLYPSGIPHAQWWHVLQLFQAQCYLREESCGVLSSPSDSSSDSESSSDDDSDEEDFANDYLEFLEPISLSGVTETRSPLSAIPKGVKVNAQSLLWCSPATLEQAIRVSFRHAARDTFKQTVWHDRALTAYRMLLGQATLWQHASVHSERHMRITAIPQCIAVLPQQNRYGYAYRILVENIHVASALVNDSPSTEPPATIKPVTSTQLLGRTWIIHTFWPPLSKSTAPDDDIIRVHAPLGACVGQQPILLAGSAFAYQSTAASSSAGRMEGCLHFCTVPEKTESSDEIGESTKQEFFQFLLPRSICRQAAMMENKQ